ncbi:MAG: RNA methyltransferase [Desulfobacterales bacterium]
MALVHYPVVNKNGEIIASAVTNLDLHDLSRTAKTYGVRTFYVVTPLGDQKELVEKIVSHWINGTGGRYNPKRKEALKLIVIKNTLDEVIDHIRKDTGAAPKTIVTSANQNPRTISFNRFREMLQDGAMYLLILGTGWGLSKNVINEADYVLNPVLGNTGYNHLSVRCAAAVMLDRLFGRND